MLGRRLRLGWEPLSVFDPHYPPRLRERLGAAAPPVLWVRNKSRALAGRLCAIVGSRQLSPEEREFAVLAGKLCTEAGFGVVSGGAMGSDRLGAAGALSAGGFAAHYLPGGESCATLGTACLLSCNPEEAEFLRARALIRNRWIYASADGAIIVASRLGQGGAWTGALEAKRRRTTPLAVYMGRNHSAGNECLARLGATPLRSPQDLRAWLQEVPPSPATLPLFGSR